MTRATTLTIAVAFLCTTAAAVPLVTYESPCDRRDNHGKHRWAEKNDPALPPAEASAIQAVTPLDIFNWQGPTEYLVPSSERIWSEQKWYALTGRVVDLRAEEDGDLHIALQDATGDKPGTVVVEIPAKPQWCELRKMYSDVIDEINRGNLSKIFGKLMMLIEADKRGKENVIPLAYSQNADEKLM